MESFEFLLPEIDHQRKEIVVGPRWLNIMCQTWQISPSSLWQDEQIDSRIVIEHDDFYFDEHGLSCENDREALELAHEHGAIQTWEFILMSSIIGQYNHSEAVIDILDHRPDLFGYKTQIGTIGRPS